jgi:hypothetical protein
VQCGDRWRLWHLLAEAAAKEVAAHSTCWAEGDPLPEGKHAKTTRERWQQVRDLRSKGVGLLDYSRMLPPPGPDPEHGQALRPRRGTRAAAPRSLVPAHPGRPIP